MPIPHIHLCGPLSRQGQAQKANYPSPVQSQDISWVQRKGFSQNACKKTISAWAFGLSSGFYRFLAFRVWALKMKEGRLQREEDSWLCLNVCLQVAQCRVLFFPSWVHYQLYTKIGGAFYVYKNHFLIRFFYLSLFLLSRNCQSYYIPLFIESCLLSSTPDQ